MYIEGFTLPPSLAYEAGEIHDAEGDDELHAPPQRKNGGLALPPPEPRARPEILAPDRLLFSFFFSFPCTRERDAFLGFFFFYQPRGTR